MDVGRRLRGQVRVQRIDSHDTSNPTVDASGALSKVAPKPTSGRWILDSGAHTPHLPNLRELDQHQTSNRGDVFRHRQWIPPDLLRKGGFTHPIEIRQAGYIDRRAYCAEIGREPTVGSRSGS